ncbi:MAG: hypothetical protein FWF67_00200 [Fibromonadales bacterium]|nr:hypothetical protein [Fibromonadales bacterium]
MIFSSRQDTYGFSALPGGCLNEYGYFIDIGLHDYWWSSSENNANAYIRNVYYGNEDVYLESYEKSVLISVRCIQD